MCGILFALSSSSPSSPQSSTSPSPSETHLTRISARGPDLTSTHTTTQKNHTLSFTSSVLSLRGPSATITPQPLIDPVTKSVLCWNGEAWRIGGVPLEPGVNDGAEVLRRLLEANGNVPGVMEGVEGPWAMVYWDGAKVWYGRDVLGRRSLLHKSGPEGELAIASVGDGEGWAEVDADGLHWVDVSSGESGIVPWGWEEDSLEGPYMKMPYSKLSPSTISASLDPTDPEIESFGQVLKDSVDARVRDIPSHGSDVRLAILFSGGLDCTVLARLVHECLPPGEPVDLLNVAFENPRVIGARAAAPKPPKKNKKKKGALDVPELEAKVPETPEPKSEALETEPEAADPYEHCPDRITGRRSHAELTRVCPSREWRFLPIDVSQETLHQHRQTVIELMRPHNTEMDLSIALAFFFASRGISSDSYTTPSRTLLSGLGADELLGGYVRHTTAYRRLGAEGLTAELLLDVSRLGRRNLGRDDRVLAHWGREARCPFLDEKVVDWCMNAALGGKRDKSLLRALARKLGMKEVAGEPKRAVQFGARSARMVGGRVKGTQTLAVEG